MLKRKSIEMATVLFLGASLSLSTTVAAFAAEGNSFQNTLSADSTNLSKTVKYKESSSATTNPGRGMYKYTESVYNWGNTKVNPLNEQQLLKQKNEEGVSTIYRVVYLQEYREKRLSAEVLNNIDKDLKTANKAGVKVILRFAYTEADNNDATPEWTKTHIRQLAPILNKNASSILYLQAGFIGQWGEWYYSNHFNENGDANRAGFQGGEWGWNLRKEIMNELTTNVSPKINIQVRYPSIIYKTVKDKDRNRVGIHNDCFLASPSDHGTFGSEADKTFLKNVSSTLPTTGETCGFFNGRSNNAEVAKSELKKYHWSSLNKDFNKEVLNSWGEANLKEVEKNLGYRYVLNNSTATQNGDTAKIGLNLTNKGYSSSGNHYKKIRVVLTEKTTGKKIIKNFTYDWNSFKSGQTKNILLSFKIPDDKGTYSVSIGVPDENDLNNSRYNIRFSNENLWNNASGSNNLKQDVVVY